MQCILSDDVEVPLDGDSCPWVQNTSLPWARNKMRGRERERCLGLRLQPLWFSCVCAMFFLSIPLIRHQVCGPLGLPIDGVDWCSTQGLRERERTREDKTRKNVKPQQNQYPSTPLTCMMSTDLQSAFIVHHSISPHVVLSSPISDVLCSFRGDQKRWKEWRQSWTSFLDVSVERWLSTMFSTSHVDLNLLVVSPLRYVRDFKTTLLFF